MPVNSQTKLIAVAGFFAVALLPTLAQMQNTKAPARQPVAVVSGKPIYDDELAPQMATQLQQLRNQEYQLKSDALQDLINKRLLDVAAQKKGTTADKIVAEEVDSKVTDPTDAELEAYYLGQNPNTSVPLDDSQKAQLRQLLKQAKLQVARQQYTQQLWKDANVGILLEPPKTEVGYDPSRLRGDPAAPVTIVEFSDFQCPYCRESYPILKTILAKYPGQVKLAYRDFPLSEIHEQAHLAAEAARCANEQGKFWQYHDLLFSNPDKLGRPGLLAQAHALKLDDKQFVSCLDSGKYLQAIDEDVRAGTTAKVEGTPALFINGVLLTGIQSESVLEKRINDELTRINLLSEMR
jgi:protein-disulfide isomerase